MARFNTLLLIAIAFTICWGCGRKANLVGNWQIDADKTLNGMKDTSLYKQLVKHLGEANSDAAIRKGFTGAIFTFTDANVTINVAGKNEEASYKISSSDGANWTLEVKRPSKSTTERAFVKWADSDHISFKSDGQDEVEFFLARK